jgi:hypothetical protein
MNPKYIPHWLQGGITIATVCIMAVLAANSNGQLTLPAVAVSILSVVKLMLGLLSDSISTTQGKVALAKAAAVTLSVLMIVVFASFTVLGCSPAQQAIEAKVEQVILNDLATGKTLQQVEADVATVLAGQPGADVVIIVNDALAFLIDIGVIPPGILPSAKSMYAETLPVAGAHRLAAASVK